MLTRRLRFILALMTALLLVTSCGGSSSTNPNTDTPNPDTDPQNPDEDPDTPSVPIVRIEKIGNGNGTVTSSPEGIDCGSDCEEVYLEDDVGETVVLTAIPNSESTFGGWSDGCVGITDTCSVVLSDDITVFARFDSPPLALEATPLDDPISSGSQARYEVTVTNQSSSPIADVQLEQTVPTDFFAFSASTDYDGGKLDRQSISWDIGTLDVGQSITFFPIIRTENLNEGTLIPSIFSVNFTGGSTLQADTSTTVDSKGLDLALDSDKKLVRVGDNLTYTLRYANHRTGIDLPATSLTVRVPEGATFVSATDEGTLEDGVVTWNLGTLSPQEYGQTQLTVTLDSAPAGSALMTNAVLTGNLNSAPSARAAATTIVKESIPLTLEAIPLDDPISSGSQARYEVTVTNQSSSPIADVQLEQTVPTDFFAFSASTDYDGGKLDRQSISWDIGTLDVGQSITFFPIIRTENLDEGTLIPSIFSVNFTGGSTLQADTTIVVSP